MSTLTSVFRRIVVVISVQGRKREKVRMRISWGQVRPLSLGFKI